MPSPAEVQHVFQQLRTGLVPERGLDTYAVGVEKPRAEIKRQLDLVRAGDGSVKFLRGGYGCGKTFMARLAIADAHADNFATSFVVVSDNDLRFHRFDEVYRKVVTELATRSCPRGALGDILDRWIGRVEEGLIASGADPEAAGFDARVSRKLDEQLAALTGGKAPQDFVRVVQTIFALKQEGNVPEAASLLSWLSGSGNVGAVAKQRAGIKGDLGSQDALAYLRGILAIVKEAGHPGLLIVIDEAETILRMRSESRHKSLNGLRQICDAAGDYPGLLWLFTGTPDFFESRKGVMGLAPLHDRIRFLKEGEFVSLKQPQLELRPFDAVRLKRVALRLRELHPTADRDRLLAIVTDAVIDERIAAFTRGFGGKVGVVPRQFLRSFVHLMDVIDENEEFVAAPPPRLPPEGLSAEEEAVIGGVAAVAAADDGDAPVPVEDTW